MAISTPDYPRALAFYRDIIGMVVQFEGQIEGELGDKITALKSVQCRIALLGEDGCQLELFEFTNPLPKPADPQRPVCDHGFTHICFSVVDIDNEYQRLKEAGVHFHCPPQNFGQAKATYGRDPDGNVFELLERLK